MQIRISWQLLLAVLVFLFAFCVLGRYVASLVQPEPLTGVVPTSTLVTTTVEVIGLAPTATADEVPSASLETEVPSVLPSPSATLTPTLSPTPTLELIPTLTPFNPPTLTPFIPPTVSPTPAPLRLTIVNQGFGQAEGVVSVAFVINNPNPELLVRDSLYQVAMYDAAGVVVKAESGTVAIVGPGQRTAVASAVEMPPGVRVARVDILLRDGVFARSAPFPQLPADNLAFLGDKNPRITGLVHNPLSVDLENVPVVAVLYDANSAIIGGGSAVVPFIPADGQAAVEVPVTSSDAPAGLELYSALEELPVEPE